MAFAVTFGWKTILTLALATCLLEGCDKNDKASTIWAFTNVYCDGQPDVVLNIKGDTCEKIIVRSTTYYGQADCQSLKHGSIRLCSDDQCNECEDVPVVGERQCGNAMHLPGVLTAEWACGENSKFDVKTTTTVTTEAPLTTPWETSTTERSSWSCEVCSSTSPGCQSDCTEFTDNDVIMCYRGDSLSVYNDQCICYENPTGCCIEADRLNRTGQPVQLASDSISWVVWAC